MIKKLPGAQGHEQAHVFARSRSTTIGYSVLCQGPNGLIHLITSVTHPDLHFVFNEAWLLLPEDSSGDAPPVPAAQSVKREGFEERYADGRLRAKWSGGVAPDGRFLLDGTKTCYRPDGQKQWQVRYALGRKVGTETYWGADGKRLWSWEHKPDGTSVWTHWWPNGRKRSESTWRGFQCEGTATRWNRSGEVADRMEFHHGMPVGVKPESPMTGVEYR